MRKILPAITLLLICLAGCTDNTFTVNVRVPAGTLVYPMHSFVPYCYSDEEICPTDTRITITLPAAATDVSVTLVPVEAKDRLRSYETLELTPDQPVEFDVEKGVWYKVAILANNNSNADVVYKLDIENVQIRVE